MDGSLFLLALRRLAGHWVENATPHENLTSAETLKMTTNLTSQFK